jgi:ribosomal-protein-alanine N-acetyltransferase
VDRDEHEEWDMMPYGIRPMLTSDVPQAQEIEHDAFPEVWPPTPFERELRNRLARHLVAYDLLDESEDDEPSEEVRRSWLGSLPIVGGLFTKGGEPRHDHLVGFVGLWFMLDEAHITAIASRSTHRGKGIGELLLIASIELALVEGAKMVTLEARVSNTVAHNLYKKYGFSITGRRKRYYSDNNEDAFVMSTEDITTPEYQEKFARLRQAHSERWGASTRYIT